MIHSIKNLMKVTKNTTCNDSTEHMKLNNLEAVVRRCSVKKVLSSEFCENSKNNIVFATILSMLDNKQIDL